MLPPSLRDEVLSITFGKIIEKVKFFKDLRDPEFLTKILPCLNDVKFDKGDVVYYKNDPAQEIYFIKKG